jgi:hypothetical protein
MTTLLFENFALWTRLSIAVQKFRTADIGYIVAQSTRRTWIPFLTQVTKLQKTGLAPRSLLSTSVASKLYGCCAADSLLTQNQPFPKFKRFDYEGNRK